MENLEPLQIWLLMGAVAYIAFMAGRATANKGDKESREARAFRIQENAESLFSSLTGSTVEEVDRLIGNGKIINAVRVVRENTGAGLKDSKDAVDWRRRSMGN